MAYDVFLSHASADKPAVEALARRLREDGIEPFLDRWHLIPGEPWQEALEDALAASRTCAVFVGKELGPWQNEEMRDALDERVRNKSFRVIPVLLPGARKPGAKKLPRFLRRLTWVDFRNGLDDDDAFRRLVSGIRGVAPDAGPVPPPTAEPYRSMARPTDQFVHRRELDAVRDLLVHAAGATVGIATALRGAGGFGKTALAQALCEDPRVREAYPHGILWAQMRDGMRDADRLAVVQDLVRFQRPDEGPSFETLHAAGARLREVLDGRRVLVVVDDAWHAADVEPFGGLGAGTGVLVTTRDGRTLPPGCRRVDVDAMEPSEAVRLLASGPEVDGAAPFAAKRLGKLAKRLGEWPLLLRLVNGQLRELIAGGIAFDEALVEIEAELDESGLTAFDVDDETAREKAVGRTLGVSLGRLLEDERQLFLELAVFPEDIDVPVSVLERFWGPGTGSVRKLCRRFHDLSLLLRFDRTAKTLRLHDVVRQYLIGEHGDLPVLHRRLLERCRPRSGRWTDLEDGETYLWRHLATHLAAAGDRTELRRLLFDLDYLEGKLRTVGVNALLADYDVLGETGDARTVQEALRLSAHVLARDWGGLLGQVLAGQLLGRLGQAGEEGRRLVQGAADRTPLRPRRVRMSRTGGPLIRTLEGHTSEVHAVAVLDEKRVVSASYDQTLRVWDVESGETIRTLEGHTSIVNAVAVLGERRVVSASFDSTLRVWDLESGETIRSLEGHTSPVLAVAVLGKRRVVSASSDNALRVWDLESGETIRTLEGHTSTALAVAVLDEKRVVSASYDRTLRVWDLKSGETIRTLQGHTSAVNAVTVLNDQRVVSASSDMTLRIWDLEPGATIPTPDGHTSAVNAMAVLNDQRVVSASSDMTLRVWDLESGETIRTLEGHTDRVNAVAVLSDQRVVSASSDKTMRVWDLESGETIRTLEGHLFAVNAVAVLSDQRVVSASSDHTLRVWDIESGATIRTLKGDTREVKAVAVLDGQRVVSSSDEKCLRVWDLESGRTIRTLGDYRVGFNTVAVLNNQRLISASYDHTLRVWDVESGETIRTLEGHTSGVSAVAVLDAKRVVSASSDKTLRVRDVESGETVAVFALDAPVESVAVTADGRRVVAGDMVGGVHFLDLVLP